MGGEPKASNMEDENMGGESGATPDNDKEEKESPT
jgi:hypothetical protein